jgi:SMODS-associating 2TM, beta-strand rich effector domain
MNREPHWRWIILVIVVLTLASFTFLLAQQDNVNPAVFKLSVTIASATSTVIYLLWLAFDKWLWKLLPRIFPDAWPDLSGRWTGAGEIVFAPPSSSAALPIDLEVELNISQTYTGIWINFESNDKGKTRKSTSHARGDLVQPNPKANYELHYHFVTDPGSYDPGKHGVAVFTLRPSKGGQAANLSGEWMSNAQAPAAGTVTVSKVQ